MRRRSIVAATVGLALVVIVGAVVVTLLVKSHQAPPPLALSTGQPPGSSVGMSGKWSVGPGSLVGYRAKEKFINQPAETEAVARTSKVTGSLVVAVSGATVKVSQMTFTVDLASLTSQDKYANYQVYQRDFFVRTVYLQTASFPTATFSAKAATFSLPVGGPVDVDISGNLTVHGITKDVTVHAQVQGGETQAEVVGSMTVDMRDFGIEPPDISFTHAEPEVTIEFDLKLVHA